MSRSQSKIKHIQQANILLEQRLLNEQANVWLTYPGDKNYQYQKQNGKWVAKIIKTGKIVDMSKYPSSVANLEKQFPNGVASGNDSKIDALPPKAITPLNTGVTSGDISGGNTINKLQPKSIAPLNTGVTSGDISGGNTINKLQPKSTTPLNTGVTSGGITQPVSASAPGGAGFVLKPGMTGVGILSDTAAGKTYVVNKVTRLKCDLIEVEFKNKTRLEYGYYEPSKYKTNSISFRRKGEGVKSANACTEYNTFGDFGHLQFS